MHQKIYHIKLLFSHILHNPKQLELIINSNYSHFNQSSVKVKKDYFQLEDIGLSYIYKLFLLIEYSFKMVPYKTIEIDIQDKQIYKLIFCTSDNKLKKLKMNKLLELRKEIYLKDMSIICSRFTWLDKLQQKLYKKRK
jgi:hypothetical protein